MIFVKRKALSSLATGDARDYINGFLIDPQPAGQWVMRHRASRRSWLAAVPQAAIGQEPAGHAIRIEVVLQ
jgi:hypothetical protein